jgi:hypothetical protein
MSKQSKLFLVVSKGSKLITKSDQRILIQFLIIKESIVLDFPFAYLKIVLLECLLIFLH